MWKGPTEGPEGGGSSEPPCSEDQIDHQSDAPLPILLPASALQERAAEYADRLNKINARVKKSKKNKDVSNIDIPARENVRLLMQQLEENKVKLAERGKNHRGIEDMVTRMKAQLDDSIHQISQTPINISLIEDRVDYTPTTSSQELYNILLNKDKRNNDLTIKINKLEANILDLQENIKEKDQVIDARTKAITLMSENLSKKGKTTLDALDDTKEQMMKMQQNFISMEDEMKVEKQKLIEELDKKDGEIMDLKSLNENLTINNLQLTEEIVASRNEDVEKLNGRIQELEAKLQNTETPNKTDESQPEDIKKSEEAIEENKKLIEQQDIIKEEYEKKLNALENIIKELKISAENTSKPEDNTDKLKKQLDEYNKNMIKVKAQHKSKIKELNKKIDAFKKIGDANVEVVRLEGENSKLSQRVAELEEEKGNMQLSSMGESKDSINLEDFKDLEKTIGMKEDQIAALLEQNEENELNISRLTEKLENMSTTSNMQVSSDLNSVQFEEQMEKFESERMTIIKDKQGEIDQLWDQIDGLKKEKQELSVKIDTYMQENMELIDRLEKLSAEKVSSAESIEIVEGLTQQEKLELEAYQKSSSGGGKSEEILEENPELNDSVNQLTEETSELLQKIELFTIERREVMDKMEFLRSENNQLLLKNKEIENNRDVLVETYEQLQTEKEDLSNALEAMKKSTDVGSVDLQEELEEFKSLVEIQKQEKRELQLKLLSQEKSVHENDNLMEKIHQLEMEYKGMLKENETLRSAATDKRIDNFESKLKENLEEIENYKSILEDNKTELISSADLIASLQSKLQEKSLELEHYHSEVEHLNSIVTDLNEAIAKLEEENELNAQKSVSVAVMSLQLDELKLALNENIEQMQDYEKELETNAGIIKNQNADLKQLNNKILEIEHALETKDDQLKTQNEASELVIGKLEGLIKEKDADFGRIFEELRGKCANLQQQIDLNSITHVETKVQELETKNREQLQKMKKIAANLKKKSVECTEIGEKWENESKEKEELKVKLQKFDEKWEVERKEKEELKVEFSEKLDSERKEKEALNVKLQEIGEMCERECKEKEELQVNLQEFKNEMRSKLLEFDAVLAELAQIKQDHEGLKEMQQDLSNQVLQYQARLEDLQNLTREYETQINALTNENELLRSSANNISNDVLTEKEELLQQLKAVEYLHETNANALQMKIHELEAYVEAQEGDLVHYKTRVDKLEEGLCSVEVRRLSLEHKAIELGAELQAKELNYAEATQAGDYLEQRLAALAEHDMLVEKRLSETMQENQELSERNGALSQQVDELLARVNATSLKLRENEENSEKLDNYESKNAELQATIVGMREELKRAQNELINVNLEADRNDSEMQEQMQQYTAERKLLTEQCELLTDQLKQSAEALNEMGREIIDAKQKLEQQQIDFEEYIEKHHMLEVDYKKSLAHIETLNTQLNSLQILLDESQEHRNSAELLNTQLLKAQEENKVLQTTLGANKSELFETHNQLQFAKNMMKEIEETNLETLGRNDAYERRIMELENAAKLGKDNDGAVDSWPNSANQPFPFFDPPAEIVQAIKEEVIAAPITKYFENADASSFFEVPTEEVVVDAPNTQEELLQKIKTLEFMLYNVEKEKENAMLQCHQLSNELTTLVYERESTLDSEVLTNDEIRKMQENLRKIEFTDCRSELCTSAESEVPVVEELCIAKSSYVCQPEETPSTTTAVLFGENDDGWAWGPEEAKLEQEHLQEVELAPPVVGNQLQEMEDKIRVYELERVNQLEELKQAQIKSGKLIKKLKEFKAKNEQLCAKLKSDDFGDLNEAIVDELKTQIGALEKKIKETNGELDREKLEKSNLLKRIDVLGAANERMVEMKEKQDVEVLAWQHRNRELTSKLEQFEWGRDDEEQNVETKHDTVIDNPDLLAKINELTDTVKDLSLDNEDLQVLLEEQRNLRLSAEKSKSMEPMAENMKTEAEYNVLLQEKLEAQAELLKAQEKMKEIAQQLQTNYAEKTQLEATVLDNAITIEDLNKQILELNYDFACLKQNQEMQLTEAEMVGELKQKLDILQADKDALSAKNDTLSTRVNFINDAMMLLEEEKDDFVNQIENLMDIVNTLKADNVVQLEKLNGVVVKKDDELKSLHEQIAHKNKELIKFEDVLIAKDAEYQLKMSATVEQLVQEWSQHVDQRGNDVAESWKLHVESRENEFKQSEDELRKEIVVLEERLRNKETNSDDAGDLLDSKDAIIAELKAQIATNAEKVAENVRELERLHVQLLEKEKEECENRQYLEDYRKELDSYKTVSTSLQEALNEKELRIVGLNVKLDELGAVNVDLSEIKQQLVDYKQQNDAYNTQVQDNQMRMHELMLEIENYKQFGQIKDQEISNLKTQLLEKDTDLEYSVQSRLLENEAVLNERLKEYDLIKHRLNESELRHDASTQELDNYRLQLQEYHTQNMELRSLLAGKDAECTEMESKLRELSAICEDDSKQLSDLQMIIEEQVLKIEELKTQLYEKSQDYDVLIAELVIRPHSRRESTEEQTQLVAEKKHVHFEQEAAIQQQPQQHDNIEDPVSRAELDLALYMLHQRDVRCEELTVELMSLLEERDTLQLRLSNAIREKEQFRCQIDVDDDLMLKNTSAASSGAIPRIILGATGTEMASEVTEGLLQEPVGSLANKLSELKTIGYRRDKTLLDAQDLRRIQQLSFLQQHKEEMSKLPAEAAARLVDASYTLSRDVQSPSKVLLNWLWGKSTPKEVNNI